MNIRLACLTVALFRALLAQGVERAYALELVSDFTWTIYERWGRVARLLGRLRLRPATKAALLTRVQPDGTVALRFPFNPPGYVATHVPSTYGVSFDVVRCAVVDYFRAQGAADLCLASWCNLDYALGEMFGLTFRRTTTLAEGVDRCDMRWTRSPRGAVARHPASRQPLPRHGWRGGPKFAIDRGAIQRDVRRDPGRAPRERVATRIDTPVQFGAITQRSRR